MMARSLGTFFSPQSHRETEDTRKLFGGSSSNSGERVAAIEHECTTLSGLNGVRGERPGAALVCHAAHFALPPAMRWIAFGDQGAVPRYWEMNLFLNHAVNSLPLCDSVVKDHAAMTGSRIRNLTE